MNGFSTDARDALRARLEAALGDEAPPAGVDPGLIDDDTPPIDLRTVCAALTDLSGQVRLQGRAFKQMQEAMEPIPARLDEVAQGHEGVAQSASVHATAVQALDARVAEARREGERKGAGIALDALLDARERLRRGLETSAAVRATPTPMPWWSRWLAVPPSAAERAVEALEEGYRLALTRLDATLAELDVREVAAPGDHFDAACMQAVEVVEGGGAAPETVIAVVRAGYSWRGSVLRPAQVRVSK